MNIHTDKPCIQVPAAVGYRLWSKSYDVVPNPLLTLEARTLACKLGDMRGKIFLDVACGTARSMIHAAQIGARVFGVDLAPEMLAVANQKPGSSGRLVRADACRMPFPDALADVVICSFGIGYIGNPEALIRELGRVAKQKGMVVVSDLHPATLEAGWRRTFRHGSALLEIESHPYTLERLAQAGNSGNLELKEVLEPHFDSPEIRIMRDAGKTEQIEEVLKIPAILVLLWQRY